MRSLKKRVVSFVSAIAMAITMLPSASLFASAASADGVTISLKKTSAGDGTDIFTNWNNEYQGKFVDSNTQEYQAGYKNGDYAKARSQYEFDANEAYTFTLDVALQDENAERDMPELQIGDKVYGQFPKATITQEMRNDHSNLPAGYEWKDGYFVYKPTLTVTPTEGGYKSIQLDFKNDDKDKVGFKALSIVKGSTGGNDSSSTGGNDSSSTTYTVTATYGEGGTATVDQSTVTEGGTATFTATPNDGYHFVNWTDNNNENAVVSTQASYTATISANTSLKANFEANAPTPTVTWPQEVYAVADNGTSNTNLNSDLVYFDGVTSGDFRVDTEKAHPILNNNNGSVSGGSKVALPFVIDDTSADVTYTIKLYAKAKENAYACLWWHNGSTYVEDLYESDTNPVLHTSGEPDWNSIFDEPATFTMTGDKFIHGTGTYYAGVAVFGNTNYINLWKVEVTKTGGADPEPTTYTVNFSGEHGTVTATAGGNQISSGDSVAEGTEVTFTAAPNSGYEFTEWNDGNTTNPRTVTVNANTTMTATFTAVPTTYTVNFSGANGSVTATAGGNPISSGDSVAEGTEVTFTAAPNSGYEFAEWNDGNTENPRTVTVNANTTMTATFTAVPTTYTVNFSGTNGTVTATAGGNAISSGDSVAEGTEVEFTAAPNSGYEFTEWNDGNTTNPRTVTVNANTTMTATFTAQSSGEVLITSLTSSESGGGRHTLGTVDFTNYTNVRFEMTSTNTQYGFNRLYINGVDHYFGDTSSRSGKLDGTESYTDVTGLSDVLFEFQGHPTTTITFYGVRVGGGEPEPTTYTVTANSGMGGIASVNKSTVTAGETATFTATPSNGYEFVKWSDDSTENPHTITINADTTLTATFRAVSTPTVTWPQEVYAVADNGTSTTNLNSEVVYFGGVTSGDFRVDTEKAHPILNNNNGSVSSGSKVALPFIIDDTSAEVTYTIKLYAKAKENAYACLWWNNGSEYVEDLYDQNTNPVLHTSGEPDWNSIFDDPATFTMKGNEFIHGTGTYYAGVAVGGGNNYINLWKVEVTKTGGTDGYAVVLPHKNAGNVTKSGDTLTASTNSARDWEFVGWYSDEACTELITTEASTAVSEGNKLYAKFDYVSYGMPIFDITTSKNSDSFNAAWGNATKDTKYKGSAITIANTTWELPTIEEEVYYTDDEGNYTDVEGNIVDEEDKVVKEIITRPMQVEIKGRGNSTWVLDKKPFQIKFEKAVQPFDMGSEKNKTWILLANHADRTLMRNQLAYDWARTALSNLPFVTDTKPVELYINGEYQGVYLLVEKSEAGSKGGRVNIQMAESNTSNIDEIGFLAEWDKLAANTNSKGYPAEDYVVRVSGGGWSELFTIKDGIPECETEGADGRPSDATIFANPGNQGTEVTNSNSTVNAIDEYLSDIAATIMSGSESDIKAKVDIDSLVDMFILQELTKNPDAGGSSFYVYKDKGAGAKLIFSPPWDFDKALGDEVRVTSPYGLYIYGGDDQNNNQDNVNTWYKKLYEQDWFKTIVRNRWKELRDNTATDPESIILPFIGDFATTYSNEINRNRDKWYTDATTEYPDNGGGFWGDRGLSGEYFGGEKTYNTQKTGLYNWVRDRIRFLDEEWDDSDWVLVDKFASDGFQLGQGNDHELYFDIDELFTTYSRVKIVVDGKGYDLRMYLDPESGEGKLAIPHQTLGNPQTSGDQGFEKISYELDPVLDADKIKAVLQAQTDWSWVREFAIYGVEADITTDPLNPQPTFRVNNASYGSLSKQVSTDVYYLLNERITAVAKEGYKFVNWTIVTDNGKNVVPITEVIPGVSETSSRLTITADMAGEIIYANFGKIQEIKFEAEDFVEFISEGYIVSKGQTGDITEGDITYTAEALAAANGGKGQKISNDAFFGRDWTHDVLGYGSESMPYDKPKVVNDNEETEIQEWDNKPYTDHKIVTEGYSGGEAVALTGPTSGIAIPFSIAEQLYEPFKFAVGYNYGDLPTHFKNFNSGDGEWDKDSLYVNIYTTAELTDEQTAALRANGWSLSEYARPDAASDYLLNNAVANGGKLQTAFYKQLPINAANTNGWTGRWMTNNGDDPRNNVQEVEISIPAGMPGGQYYISVATDHNNLKRDSARMRLQENGALQIIEGGNNSSGYYDAGNKDNYALYSEGNYTDTPGTAYYDYIKFYTASTPDKPSQITVGANFIFKDMFGNSLMTNEFTDASFDEGLVTFTPKVPRYLKVQGYKIDRWEYTDPNGEPAVLYVTDLEDDSLQNGNKPNDDGTWNNNIAFELLAQRLETLHYKQGTTVTFTAHYTVPNRQYEVTLNNGTMYTWDENTGEFDDLVEPHEIYLVGNYQKIKLVADDSRLGVFSHWELNGQIYSYDPEIFFTAWTNAKFEACYVEEAPELKAATFIDTENIQMYGFTDDTTTAYNKITFNCAFYIPDGVEYVEGGLLYTPDEAKLQDPTIESLVTIDELGELYLPDDGRIAVSVLRYEQLDHDLNNQVLMSITGTKKGKMRTARTYIIYKQEIDGVPKYTLAFSQDYVTVEAGDEKYMSTI